MDKSVLKSKTFWMSLIVALAPLIPPVQAYVQANTEMVGLMVGGIFAVLRVITKDKVTLLP